MKKKKHGIVGRLLAVCLSVILLLTAVPAMSLQESHAGTNADYTWTVKIKTSNDTYSGTDSNVHFKILWVDESGNKHTYRSRTLDEHGNDFERGDNDAYTFTVAGNDRFDPWQAVEFGIEVDGSDGWKCASFTVTLPGGATITTNTGSSNFEKTTKWWKVPGEFQAGAQEALQRNCEYSGFFENQTIHLTENKEVNLGSASITMKDQFSNTWYNPWERSFAPEVSVDICEQYGDGTLQKGEIFDLTQGSSQNQWSLKTNSNLYNTMKSKGVESIHLQVKAICKNKTYNGTTATQRNANEAVRDIWIYKDVFALDIPTNTTTMDTLRNNYFQGTSMTGSSEGNGDFYINGKEVVFRTAVTHVYGMEASSRYSTALTIANDIANQIRKGTAGTLTLYKGNGTNRKEICQMKPDSSATGTNLIFKGTLPDNYDSEGVGVSLGFSFSGDQRPSYEGRRYDLKGTDDTGVRTQYLSNLKIDQKAPTLQKYYKSDNVAYEYTVDDFKTYRKTHTVVPVFSEQLYQDGTKNGKALATYRIRKQGESVDTKILNTSGAGMAATSQAMPVFTTANSNNAITLALGEPKEGIFQLMVEAEDVAHNKLKESKEIYMDNKAPEVSVNLSTGARALDGTRSMEVKFNITDVSGTGRLNYCFVQDGLRVPDPGSQMTEIPQKVKDSQWCFVGQNSLSGTTSTVLQIGEEKEFVGTLYYYTTDDAGNDSREEKGEMYSMRIELYNKTGSGTVMFGVAQEDEGKQGVKNYVITPELGENTKFCYYYQNPQTLEKTKLMNAKNLSDNAYQPGAAKVTMEDGTERTLDGTWSFVYYFENLSSNIKNKEQRKTLIFDNASPTAALTWDSQNTVAAQQQKVRIQMSDSARIVEAGYYVDSEDTNRIALPVNSEGKVDTTVELVPDPSTKNKFSICLWAKDENGHIYNGSPGNAAYYIIGTPEAEITLDNTKVEWRKLPVVNNGDTFTVTVKSRFKANDYEGLHAQVCYSLDGLIWNQWRDVDNLSFKDGQFTGSVTFTNSMFRLHEGLNTIYVKSRIYSGDKNPSTHQTVSTYSSDTVNPPSAQVYYDTKAPECRLEYSETEMTNQDVAVTLTAADALTGTEGMTVSGPDGITWEENTDTPGTYTTTLTTNTTGTIKVEDHKGNQTELSLNVNWIDKTKPEIYANAETIQNGTRTDGKITVTASGITGIEFGLVPTSAAGAVIQEDGSINPTYVEYFQNPANLENESDISGATIETVETETGRTGTKRDVTYQITLRGLTGTYALAARAEGAVGNFTSNANLCSITLEDKVPDTPTVTWKELVNSTEEGFVLPDRNVAQLTFDSPVYVLTDSDEDAVAEAYNEISANQFKTSWEVTVESAAEKTLTYLDDLYRVYTYELDGSQGVRADGNTVAVSVAKNGKLLTQGADEWLGLQESDHVQVTLKLDETKQPDGGYLWIEENGLTGFTINQDQSTVYIPPTPTPTPEVTETPIPETTETPTPEETGQPEENTTRSSTFFEVEDVEIKEERTGTEEDPLGEGTIDTAEPTKYTTLVLDLDQTASAHKIKYQSCVKSVETSDHGTGIIQPHVYELRNIDTTAALEPASSTYEYSIASQTNRFVEVRIPVDDPESGIASVTKTVSVLDEQNNTYKTVVQVYDGRGMVKDVFDENGTTTYTITNGAGLTSTFDVTVGNINKSALTSNDYGIQYYADVVYQDSSLIAESEKAYRSVRAVITPKDGKQISVQNNGESREVILYDNKEFKFQLIDAYGNTGEAVVSHEQYDNNSPEITITLPEQTQEVVKSVTVGITVTDLENGGAIAKCEASAVSDGAECKTLREGSTTGQYTLEIGKNGKYMVEAYDLAGNHAETTFTVTNIMTLTPALKTDAIEYTPRDVTRGAVTAKLEFWSDGQVNPKVHIKNVAPAEGTGLRESDISYGTNTVTFKANGTVNVTFADQYGNEGQGVVTVNHIVNEAPNVVPIVELSQNETEAVITFQMKDADGHDISTIGDVYGRTLADLTVSSSILDYSRGAVADKARLVATQNGTYDVSISDKAGNTRTFAVNITGISKTVAKVTSVVWSYKYWDLTQKTLLEKTGNYSVDDSESGLLITSRQDSNGQIQNSPATNQDVTVTLTTDKPVKQVGSKKEFATTTSMNYTEDGTFSFNLQAQNQNITQYPVTVDLIDKEAPVIELDNPELVFVEGTQIEEDMYKKELLTKGLAVYDVDKDGNKVPIDTTASSENWTVSYGEGDHTFDPDDMTKNEFNRNKPYTITYTAIDAVGNETTFVQTVTLVGKNDTVALINGRMPSSNNSLTVHGGTIAVTLKNHGGKSYIKYEKGFYTMGEMKTRGTMMPLVDNVPTLTGLSSGWYTVSVQTDKRDYFTIQVYVAPEDESDGEETK